MKTFAGSVTLPKSIKDMVRTGSRYRHYLSLRQLRLAAKIALAAQLRREVGASCRWITSALKINFSTSIRVQVHHHTLHVSA
jgi:hypothetical protein